MPDAERDEDLVHAAMTSLGLNRHHHFDPHQHIIEWALAKEVISELDGHDRT